MAFGPKRGAFQVAKVGLIIGRFQPVHWGHVRAFEWVRGEGLEVHVGIGSSQFSATRENPFTAAERRRMLEAADRVLGLKVGRVDEVPDIFDDERWVGHVQACCGPFDVVFTNNEWTAELFAKAGLEVRATPMFDRERFVGAKIRESVKERGLAAVEDLVPPPVMALLKEFEAEKRIRASWPKPTPARR